MLARTIRSAATSLSVFALAFCLPLTGSTSSPRQTEDRQQQDSRLAEVLRRAADATERYATEAAVIIGDETCDQAEFVTDVTEARSSSRSTYSLSHTPSRRVKWKAEYALVQTQELSQSGYPWMEFRDIVEVNGKQVRDEKKRLETLFVRSGGWTLKRVRTVLDDAARYNLGPTIRNINTPALALAAAVRTNQSRFQFAKMGEEAVDGSLAWRVSFHETSRPTLIRGGADGTMDLPMSGTLWIDPSNGEIIRTELSSADSRWQAVFTRQPRFGIRLPHEMHEKSGPDTEWVEGKCTYSNYRRFETGGRLIIPK